MACFRPSEVTVQWVTERVARDWGRGAGKGHSVNGFRGHSKKFGLSFIYKAIKVYSFFSRLVRPHSQYCMFLLSTSLWMEHLLNKCSYCFCSLCFEGNDCNLIRRKKILPSNPFPALLFLRGNCMFQKKMYLSQFHFPIKRT